MIRYPTPFLKLFYAFLLFLAGTHVASFIKASYVVDFLHHDVTPGSPSLSRDQKGHGLFAPFNPPPPAKTRAQMIVDRRKNKQDPLKPFKPYQPTIHMAPETLEQRALQQFDALRKKGSLFWDDNPPQIVKGQPFDFQFRFASSMAKKPYLPPSDPGRSTSTNAFTDDDPLFRLESIGSQHLLILNKFCIVRPMLLLHTASFVPQSDALNEGDLAAAWEVLGRMDTPQMVIYNCGANAGSSQGHKHLQIFPSPEGDGFKLWPGLGIDEETSAVPGVPFKHAVKKLSRHAKPSQLVEIYRELLAKAGIDKGQAHNFIAVKEWMLVVPRSTAREGDIAANAASMVGMIWVANQTEVQDWVERDPMKVLVKVGVEKDQA